MVYVQQTALNLHSGRQKTLMLSKQSVVLVFSLLFSVCNWQVHSSQLYTNDKLTVVCTHCIMASTSLVVALAVQLAWLQDVLPTPWTLYTHTHTYTHTPRQ